MTDLRADDLRVGVVGMGIGQSHLLSWLDVDGASATVFAEIDETKRAQGEAAWGIPGVASLDDLLDPPRRTRSTSSTSAPRRRCTRNRSSAASRPAST